MNTSQKLNVETRRILVTGGLGFVGFNLCQKLLEFYPNCELTIVDNLSSTQLDYQALVGRASIHVQDLRNFNAYGYHYDEVYHLASPVGSLGILKRHGHIATDIMELAQIASDIASHSAAKLLYLSSSEVYGRDGQHDEAANQIVPARFGSRMEYALGKLTAEHMLINLADKGHHEVRIARPFNVVGANQSDSLGFVIPTFFKAALAGKQLPVHGNGDQTRSFCAVEDLVLGLISIQSKGYASTLYNVGNPNNRTSIFSLAERIRKLCDSHSTIIQIDPTQRYGLHYLEAFNKIPDIKRIKAHTNWAPTLSLSHILAQLHSHYCEPTPTLSEQSTSGAQCFEPS